MGTVVNELRRGTRRPERVQRGGNLATPQSAERRLTGTTEHPATGAQRSSGAHASFAGLSSKCGNTNGTLDACCGYAKLHRLFKPSEMVCSRTLYNWVWKGLISLNVMELPDALRRNTSKPKSHENKRAYGKSISMRPPIANLRTEEGHWEGDTVVGKKNGREAVILSLLEKKTENYLAIRIRNKTSQAVMEAMQALRTEFGDNFSTVFKTITVDNGSEFSDFAKLEDWGVGVFFAHPYSSWERPQNERHNGLLRAFFPKGVSLEPYSDEDVRAAADELNGRPRRTWLPNP